MSGAPVLQKSLFGPARARSTGSGRGLPSAAVGRHVLLVGRGHVKLAVRDGNDKTAEGAPYPEVDDGLSDDCHPLLPLLLRGKGKEGLAVGVLQEEGVGPAHRETGGIVHHHRLQEERGGEEGEEERQGERCA